MPVLEVERRAPEDEAAEEPDHVVEPAPAERRPVRALVHAGEEHHENDPVREHRRDHQPPGAEAQIDQKARDARERQMAGQMKQGRHVASLLELAQLAPLDRQGRRRRPRVVGRVGDRLRRHLTHLRIRLLAQTSLSRAAPCVQYMSGTPAIDAVYPARAARRSSSEDEHSDAVRVPGRARGRRSSG